MENYDLLRQLFVELFEVNHLTLDLIDELESKGNNIECVNFERGLYGILEDFFKDTIVAEFSAIELMEYKEENSSSCLNGINCYELDNFFCELFDNATKNAKLIVDVDKDEDTDELITIRVFDNRTQEEWSEEQIKERGIEKFGDFDDLFESLNWNVNGDSKKFKFEWIEPDEDEEEPMSGRAYVFD